ncbi:MAG TPA: helix-turn-helix transcriptional regulator [Archangium sp.]|uniref:helix-turn-helix transcriptional regulator n=1 Tax=Archangium sp. TaxID=1872627 RepID=UPI002E328593|nr:helix-turn-helix transcriptional regulator [Archangium sp.]HEX5754131.1 helix-turn-helix transcriptional regulator [Archangium sp.]
MGHGAVPPGEWRTVSRRAPGAEHARHFHAGALRGRRTVPDARTPDSVSQPTPRETLLGAAGMKQVTAKIGYGVDLTSLVDRVVATMPGHVPPEVRKRLAEPLRNTLRTVRQLVELSQADMAQRIGMPEQAYGRFERDSSSLVPSASTLRRMYRVLESSVDELLGPECGEDASEPAAKPSGASRSRQPASRRSRSHSRTGRARRLALRVDVE